MKTKIFVGVMSLLTIAILIAAAFPKHKTSVERDGCYEINLPYPEVKKILVRRNALEEMITSQYGQLVNKHTKFTTISSNKLISLDWDADTSGDFTVIMNNPQTGPLKLTFNQTAHVGKDGLTSDVVLAGPVGNLKHLRISTKMSPSGDKTKVCSHVELEYERRLPWYLKGYMDAKVAEAADDIMSSGQQSMIKFVTKYSGKKFIIPIR
jgi:hypothetical protein